MDTGVLIAIIAGGVTVLVTLINSAVTLYSLRVSLANSSTLKRQDKTLEVVERQTNGLLAHAEAAATAKGITEGHAAGVASGVEAGVKQGLEQAATARALE
jgi:hypothetical protein